MAHRRRCAILLEAVFGRYSRARKSILSTTEETVPLIYEIIRFENVGDLRKEITLDFVDASSFEEARLKYEKKRALGADTDWFGTLDVREVPDVPARMAEITAARDAANRMYYTLKGAIGSANSDPVPHAEEGQRRHTPISGMHKSQDLSLYPYQERAMEEVRNRDFIQDRERPKPPTPTDPVENGRRFLEGR